MKYLTVFILIMSLFTFQFSELLVYVSFKINQEYIAKKLCVEKDLEGSTCHGCCQLKKRMEEQQESKKALPPVQTEKHNIDFIGQSDFFTMTYYPESEDLISKKVDENINCIPNRIFHPPKV